MRAAIDSPVLASAASTPAYADLVDLLEPAPLLLTVQIAKVAVVEPERAKNVRPGWVRMYVEGRVLATLRGAVPVGGMLSYLADVPLSVGGKPPMLNKRSVLLVARAVAGRPDMVQLVAPDAQLDWDPAMAVRVHAVLDALEAPDAPKPVTGVREASHVAGTLVGEGETQIFLRTANGSPAAISVTHRPGKPATWSVSFSEVIDASGKPPARDTLAWYRLACFLPGDLPLDSNVSETDDDRAQALADYHLVLAGLGPCGRTR